MPRRKKSSIENHSRSSLSINKEKPQQRYAANARERARMRVLSRAFCRLKTTLPWVPADTKLSKLDTLRLAASYIAHLKGILRDETLGSSESSLHPAMSMTWPFGFNRPLGGSAGGGSQEGGSIEGSEDDMEDDDDDDGESISSCTWEEVSPPSSAKDCVHLDTNRRHARGRSRGKGSCNNLVQVRGKETSSPSTLYLSKQNVASSLSPTSNNNNQEHYANKNTHMMIRPLSQIQHHHHSHFPAESAPLVSEQFRVQNKMGLTNLENAPPTLQPSFLEAHNDDGMGMGHSSPLLNASFEREMNSDNFTPQDLQHHHQNLHHHDGGEMHNIGSGEFAFSHNDLMSIG